MEKANICVGAIHESPAKRGILFQSPPVGADSISARKTGNFILTKNRDYIVIFVVNGQSGRLSLQDEFRIFTRRGDSRIARLCSV